MRAVINTLAASLGEERTKTIEDLKRQMVIMKEENIKLFSEEEEKHVSRKIPKKRSKKAKIWRLCFKYQLTI